MIFLPKPGAAFDTDFIGTDMAQFVLKNLRDHNIVVVQSNLSICERIHLDLIEPFMRGR
jgi:hypothetical protein